jgi:hypothetical protein
VSLLSEGGDRRVLGRAGDNPHLAGLTDSAPLAPERPLSEQIRLHVEAIVPAHAPIGVDAAKGEGAHGRSLEIVEWLTL